MEQKKEQKLLHVEKNISLPCEEHQKSACSLFKRLPAPAAVAS